MPVTVNDYTEEALQEMVRLSNQRCVIDFVEIFVMHIKDLSPYETGHNRDSVRMEPATPNLEDPHLTVTVQTESGYGGWLEVGTARMAARPYFAPAYERTRSDFHA